MSETENVKKESGNIFILMAAGIILYLYSSFTTMNFENKVFPVIGMSGLIFLYAGLKHFEQYGKLVKILKIMTAVAAAFTLGIFLMKRNGISNTVLVTIADLYQCAYLFVYVTLVEKIAASYRSEMEISIHIAKTVCLTTELLNQLVPNLLANYSRVSSTLMTVLMNIIIYLVLLILAFYVLRMKWVVKKGTPDPDVLS